MSTCSMYRSVCRAFIRRLAMVIRASLRRFSGSVTKIFKPELELTLMEPTGTLHLPGGDTRTLILCQKISQTPTAYPRNGGKIAKSPLK